MNEALRNDDRRCVTYVPNHPLRRGVMTIARDIVDDLVDNRWLTRLMLQRDVLAFYKQSLLGMFWVVLVPVVTVGAFMALRRSGVIQSEHADVPYPVYAAVGVIVWQIFAQGIVAASKALLQNAQLLTRINCSKKSLVLASFGRTGLTFLIGFAVVLLGCVAYRPFGWTYAPGWGALAFPLAIVPLWCFTLACAFPIALLNAVIRDVGAALSMMIPFALLATPIMYAPRASTGDGWLDQLSRVTTDFNPLYHLTTAPRELLLTGSLRDPSSFLIASAAAVVGLLISTTLFHLAESTVIERL